MHDLLKIVWNSVSNVQIGFISSALLRSWLFGITCFGKFRFLTLVCKHLYSEKLADGGLIYLILIDLLLVTSVDFKNRGQTTVVAACSTDDQHLILHPHWNRHRTWHPGPPRHIIPIQDWPITVLFIIMGCNTGSHNNSLTEKPHLRPPEHAMNALLQCNTVATIETPCPPMRDSWSFGMWHLFYIINSQLEQYTRTRSCALFKKTHDASECSPEMTYSYWHLCFLFL